MTGVWQRTLTAHLSPERWGLGPIRPNPSWCPLLHNTGEIPPPEHVPLGTAALVHPAARRAASGRAGPLHGHRHDTLGRGTGGWRGDRDRARSVLSGGGTAAADRDAGRADSGCATVARRSTFEKP